MFNLSDYIGPIIIFLLIASRLVKTQPVKDSFKGVIILIVIGAVSVYHALPDLTLNFATIVIIAWSCITGLVFGAIRGTTVKVYLDRQTNTWMRSGSIMTIIVFVIGVAVNEGVAHLLLSNASSISGVTEMLHMGLSILAGRIVHLNKRAIAQGRR
ncbi:hypothetical protein KAR50_08030 [Periweissella fabaria]|uniref:DUF1453 domain-containing protein n=1 Tax=Periweissella fabaria TaxID=546157 RepID=A0ABM8Z758_9LACO|nr:hypothetical protein [Periweissella fabaria]MCM0597783.1 hypothetical protein [Periweissella fabaria]CAH0417232.1 hypothetical protein WFA24289_01564 [Periweissella fabaria]